MYCNGCQKDQDKIVYWSTHGEDIVRYCRDCAKPSASHGAIADVWYGYGSGMHSEENIADPVTGNPIPFYDKASKAAAMKKAGVHEAGDRIHGARNEDMLRYRQKKGLE